MGRDITEEEKERERDSVPSPSVEELGKAMLLKAEEMRLASEKAVKVQQQAWAMLREIEEGHSRGYIPDYRGDNAPHVKLKKAFNKIAHVTNPLIFGWGMWAIGIVALLSGAPGLIPSVFFVPATAIFSYSIYTRRKAERLALPQESKVSEELIQAAMLGDTESLEAILKKDPKNIYAKDADDMTALHWAAYEGHAEAVKMLLSFVDPESMLMSAGINRCAVDKNGDTPLLLAVRNKHVYAVQQLLEGMPVSEIDHKNNSGLSARDIAVRDKQDWILREIDQAREEAVQAEEDSKAAQLRKDLDKHGLEGLMLRSFIIGSSVWTEQAAELKQKLEKYCPDVLAQWDPLMAEFIAQEGMRATALTGSSEGYTEKHKDNPKQLPAKAASLGAEFNAVSKDSRAYRMYESSIPNPKPTP